MHDDKIQIFYPQGKSTRQVRLRLCNCVHFVPFMMQCLILRGSQTKIKQEMRCQAVMCQAVTCKTVMCQAVQCQPVTCQAVKSQGVTEAVARIEQTSGSAAARCCNMVAMLVTRCLYSVPPSETVSSPRKYTSGTFTHRKLRRCHFGMCVVRSAIGMQSTFVCLPNVPILRCEQASDNGLLLSSLSI